MSFSLREPLQNGQSCNEYGSAVKLPWVPEAFHARYPVSVKSFKSDPLRRSCLRPLADEKKLPVAREKKPLVPRVQ